MKLRKVLLWVGGIVLALVLVVWLGGWGLLKSPFARQAAADQLSNALGVPVEVDSLDLGGKGTTAALRIPDGNDNLVRIGKLETDITLGGLLGGNATPTFVTAGDVDFLLRIDEQGNILSPFPKGSTNPPASNPAIPEVKINGGKVCIRQAGKPEFTVSGVTGHLRKDGEAYVLDGTVDDPAWGKWAIAGRLTADFSDGRVSLTSAAAELNVARLRTIPYVPNEVWDHLSAVGITAAEVAFTFKPNTDLGYAVTLKPKKASLTVPDVKVTLTDVTGDIRIADGKVTVTDGAVKLADGSGTLSGEYVFFQRGAVNSSPSEPTAVITVKADAAGLDVTKLPAEWGLPKGLEGKLKGNANLELRMDRDGKLDTRGGGDAQVLGAKLKGIPIDEFKLTLRGGEGGYRFEGADAVR